jgi:hypothetical protein
MESTTSNPFEEVPGDTEDIRDNVIEQLKSRCTFDNLARIQTLCLIHSQIKCIEQLLISRKTSFGLEERQALKALEKELKPQRAKLVAKLKIKALD